MQVTFYTFSKKPNSTLRPSTTGTAVQVELKDSCSVLSPVLSLKYTGQNPTGWNYAYIPDFHRYYFITDWTYADRQWSATLDVDVLASYKTAIGASSQYVTRAASQYDPYIADGLYPVKPDVSTSAAETAGYFWPIPAQATHYTFVVTTMGRRGWQEYYIMSGLQYAAVCAQIFGTAFYNGYDFGDLSVDAMKLLASPENNVVSVQWFPIDFDLITGAGIGAAVPEFSLGSYTPITGSFLTISPTDTYTVNGVITLSKHPDADLRGQYLSGNAYTTRNLYIPGVGTIPLDNDRLIGWDALRITCDINLASGTATYTIYGGDASDASIRRRLQTFTGKVSVDFGYGTTRMDALGMVSSLINTANAAANENVLGAVDGIINGLKSAFPQTEVRAVSGSIGAYLTPLRLDEAFYRPVDEDLPDRGRPLCKVVTISTLSGYVKTSDAKLEIPATETEVSRVLAFLNGGFFYE